MTANDFDRLIGSLQPYRPLRVTRLSHRDVASLEWQYPDGRWEHLMTIPNGPIHTFRHEDYRDTTCNVAHQSLRGVYNKLVTIKLISPNERTKFL